MIMWQRLRKCIIYVGRGRKESREIPSKYCRKKRRKYVDIASASSDWFVPIYETRCLRVREHTWKLVSANCQFILKFFKRKLKYTLYNIITIFIYCGTNRKNECGRKRNEKKLIFCTMCVFISLLHFINVWYDSVIKFTLYAKEPSEKKVVKSLIKMHSVAKSAKHAAQWDISNLLYIFFRCCTTSFFRFSLLMLDCGFIYISVP